MVDEWWYQAISLAVRTLIPLILAYLSWQVHWCQTRIRGLKEQIADHHRVAELVALEFHRLSDDIRDVKIISQGHVTNMMALAEKCSKEHSWTR